MAGRECYHCKQWVEAGEAHDCWTTTEAALTEDLPEELRDAWERLRESLADLGEQRIYASGSCIMFSRDVCYVFVRPKRKVLEVCVFLDRPLSGPLVRRADRSSKVKFANILHLQHRDQVEAPITGWFAEAYAFCGAQRTRAVPKVAVDAGGTARAKKRAAPTPAARPAAASRRAAKPTRRSAASKAPTTRRRAPATTGRRTTRALRRR
jgi:hypothetical protein